MVSISSIRAQLAAYKPPSGAQANIKAALEVFVEMEPQLPADAIVQGIRDDFPPQVLYSPEVTRGPHNLFRHIRDYLVIQGVQYEPAEGTNRIIHGLPKMLYTSEDERTMAMSLLDFMSAMPHSTNSHGTSCDSNRTQPLNQNGYGAQMNDRTDNTRLAHNVATRFKKEDRFSGDINEDIKEYLSGYEDVALDYNLTEAQKLAYLHNMLRGEAKIYYKSIKLNCRSFEDAREKLITKYSDIIRQNRIRKTLQSVRSCISWNTLTRPDVSCAVAKAAQITAKQFEENKAAHVKTINSLVSYIHRTADFELQYPKLDKLSLRIQAYTDAAFGNNADFSSQLGYMIFLADKFNTCQPLMWSSHKSKRATRSVLGSEVMAFADGFDVAYSLKYDLEHMMQQKIPLVMLTDSLSLFDVITKASGTKEKRLAIDLACANQAYQRFEINTLGFIRSENNPADALTKVSSKCNLKNILLSNKLNHPIDQWITRYPESQDVEPIEGGSVEI